MGRFPGTDQPGHQGLNITTRRAQNGQVDVKQNLLVRCPGLRVVARGHDQRMHSLRGVGIYAGRRVANYYGA